MVTRIDYDDKGGLDDVAVSNVDMFCMEYMDDKTVWLRLYRKGKKDIVFWLQSKSRIDGKHEFD